MITIRRKELSAILDELNLIDDKKDRISETRRIVGELPVLGYLIQYTYHPAVKFDLPEDVPESLWVKARHDDFGALRTQVKKLKNLWVGSNVARVRKESMFLNMLSMVTANDAALLLGVKAKRLPQRKLTENFCKEALPELFPVQENPVIEE